ncbi:MAG: proton-conducting transporter membrane subunit, partial [Bacteroidota bacterium]
MFSNEFISQLPDKIEAIWQSLSYVLPEFLLVIGILLLTLSTFRKRVSSSLISALISFFFLFITAYAIFIQKQLPPEPDFFLGLLRLDPLAIGLKLIFVFITATSIGINLLNPKRKLPVEWYIFLLSALLALQIMVMAVNFLSLYLALETLSISLYMMVILFFDRKGVEGSLKYLLYGALSSGLMIYGMSFLYGFSGSLDFSLLNLVELQSPVQMALFGFALL